MPPPKNSANYLVMPSSCPEAVPSSTIVAPRLHGKELEAVQHQATENARGGNCQYESNRLKHPSRQLPFSSPDGSCSHASMRRLRKLLLSSSFYHTTTLVRTLPKGNWASYHQFANNRLDKLEAYRLKSFFETSDGRPSHSPDHFLLDVNCSELLTECIKTKQS